jgi:hypothetical protein
MLGTVRPPTESAGASSGCARRHAQTSWARADGVSETVFRMATAPSEDPSIHNWPDAGTRPWPGRVVGPSPSAGRGPVLRIDAKPKSSLQRLPQLTVILDQPGHSARPGYSLYSPPTVRQWMSNSPIHRPVGDRTFGPSCGRNASPEEIRFGRVSPVEGLSPPVVLGEAFRNGSLEFWDRNLRSTVFVTGLPPHLIEELAPSGMRVLESAQGVRPK